MYIWFLIFAGFALVLILSRYKFAKRWQIGRMVTYLFVVLHIVAMLVYISQYVLSWYEIQYSSQTIPFVGTLLTFTLAAILILLRNNAVAGRLKSFYKFIASIPLLSILVFFNPYLGGWLMGLIFGGMFPQITYFEDKHIRIVAPKEIMAPAQSQVYVKNGLFAYKAGVIGRNFGDSLRIITIYTADSVQIVAKDNLHFADSTLMVRYKL